MSAPLIRLVLEIGGNALARMGRAAKAASQDALLLDGIALAANARAMQMG